MKIKYRAETVAEAYLELLALRGIDYFFANPGTDFASLVEAFQARKEQGKEFPRPLAVPHEIPLVCMANGYYLATGRPQVAMAHVNVGTANSIGGLMSAQRGRVPILFSAGRTPITEEGSPASRSGQIHWGQENFDQSAMVREYVKWDYELRTPSQLETVVDRALAIAMTEPRGPVYLTLPREVLLSPVGDVEFSEKHRYDLPTFYPDPAKIQDAADLLVRAQFPMVITSAIGRSPAAVQALKDLAEAGAVAVVSFKPETMNFPGDHPCHQGFSPAPLFEKADVILVVDCDVPWFPKLFKPKDSAKIIQAGIDPFYSSYPIRGFPSDLTLQGEPAQVLSALTRAVTKHPDRDDDRIAARRLALKERHDEITRGLQEAGRKAGRETPLDFLWVAHSLSPILGDDTVVVNEYPAAISDQFAHGPSGYFGAPHAGYLGWGLGAALGIKLGLPERTVIVTVGDGAYLFSVPSACHFVSQAQKLPILFIIYNNQCWNAVKQSTRSVHPDGVAAASNQYPLSDLQPAGHYEKICEAFGGYGERVETPDQVGPALDRALYAVRHEKRQALLNMICKHP